MFLSAILYVRLIEQINYLCYYIIIKWAPLLDVCDLIEILLPIERAQKDYRERRLKRRYPRMQKDLIEIQRDEIFGWSIKPYAFPGIYQLIGPSRQPLSREHHPELCTSQTRFAEGSWLVEGRARVIDGL